MLKYYFWTSEIKLILLAGVCYGLSELHIAEAKEFPLPADSWDNSSSMGKHPINIAEAKELPLPTDSWDNSSSMENHSINATTASDFSATEPPTPTGETSSRINDGISPLHSLHF